MSPIMKHYIEGILFNRKYENPNSEGSHNNTNTRNRNNNINNPLEISMTFANINNIIRFEGNNSERQSDVPE